MPSETLYFFKPTAAHGQFSQWYPSRFTSAATSTAYTNAEQYMMHGKGLLFAPDSPVTASILAAPPSNPGKMRALGRQIPGFDEDVWEAERYAIVVEGNYLKFSQDDDLRRYLLATGSKELVEAAPRDRVWGVGFAVEKAEGRRADWGLNLLGKALMEVRERLKAEEAGKKDSEAVKEGSEVMNEVSEDAAMDNTEVVAGEETKEKVKGKGKLGKRRRGDIAPKERGSRYNLRSGG